MAGNVELRNIALLGRYGVDYRRESGHDVSEAHNIPHLRNVADLTQLVADLYGYTDREKKLAYTSGWFHDTVRSPSEDPSVADDEASAKEAVKILYDADGRNVIKTTTEEREAISFAIKQHGHFPDLLADEKTRNANPRSLEEKLWLALFVADKMEANGVRVIARRSSFVAGDRLKSEKGDWRNFGFQPDRDENLVVAIESILRLTFVNPEEVYPESIQPLVHPLYEAQREFVLGICKASGLKLVDLAQMLLNNKTAEGKNILVARKIKAPANIGELVAIIASRGHITDKKIVATSDDVAASAHETVGYFSDHYRDDLDQLVEKWVPANKISQQWQKAMVEYNNGAWLKGKKEEFALARRVKENTKHDESLMPLRMGPAARVPFYAYPAWGLDPLNESQIVELYRAEWAMGNQNQLALVTQASEESGFGNYPKLLRQKNADVVAAILKDYQTTDGLRILDVGAGPGLSALAIYDALPDTVKAKTTILLLDPSAASLHAAEKLLKEHGVNFQIIHDVDLHIDKHVQPNSVDIVTGVASIHHHAQIPFDIYHQVLKPGGFAIFADWHNSIWEHPRRVYDFLQTFDWATKSEGLKEWREMYPAANVSVEEPINPADQQANRDIIKFWQGYANIVRQNGHLGPNAIWPLEGHRPVERYVKAMQDAGFALVSKGIKQLFERNVLESNPHQVLPDSRLLMVTVGQKV